MEAITSYRTKDGKIFEIKEEAEAHETFIASLTKLKLITAEILCIDSAINSTYSEVVVQSPETLYFLAPSTLSVEQYLFNKAINPAIKIEDVVERNITISTFHDKEESTVEDLKQFIELSKDSSLELLNAIGVPSVELIQTVLNSFK